MARSRKRPEQYWKVVQWRNRGVQTTSFCLSLEGAIKESYQVFVSGEGFPEDIVTPDQATIGDDDENVEEGAHESLSALWDQWLEQHPDERAEWDTGPRTSRLQLLEEQHVPNPRPFTSQSIIANPGWYRRLYGILGITDEQFNAFLHLHRFAIAEKEAQKRAKEKENQAPRAKRTTAAIYLDGYPIAPELPVVPLEKQAQACRAYCKRMGYKVHHVYQAFTPAPQGVPLREEIGIGPEHAFTYIQRDSKHPYWVVHNLLDARTIDVIVEFTETGPSRSLFGNSGRSPDESSHPYRVEWASLWEIEPPTEDERTQHELLTRVGDTESDEERSALLEKLHTLRQKQKREKEANVPALTQALSDTAMLAEQPKICYACRSRPAREGSAFCSETCAQAIAEHFVQATTRGWCNTCGTWIGGEGCPHIV